MATYQECIFNYSTNQVNQLRFENKIFLKYQNVNGGQQNSGRVFLLETQLSVGCLPHIRLESLPKIKRLVQSVTTKTLFRQLTCLLKIQEKKLGKNQNLINGTL